MVPFFSVGYVMAGGVYTGRPFAFNVKCIVFTAAVAGGYWFLPPRKWWVLAFLLWMPYVAMAWYDHLYACRDQMSPTIVPFGRWLFLPFKPGPYKRDFDGMAQSQIDAMDRLDHVMGWTLVAVAMSLAAKKLLM
jgi:hypothetical protein